MTFGLGGLGAIFAGYAQTQLMNYATLAAAATIAGLIAVGLWAAEARHGDR